MRRETILALVCLVMIGFGAGQFLIGIHVIDLYVDGSSRNFVTGMWAIGVIAEVWFLFSKLGKALTDWLS